MGAPHITSFCWCFGLETGTRLIGIAHLLVSLIMLVVCSLFAADASMYVGTVEDGEERLYSTWYTISVAVAVVSVVHVLLAATLLFAAVKRSTAALRVWLLLMAVLYCASLGYVVFSLASGFADSGSDIFLGFVEGILFFGVLAYCMLCVYSFYLMLRSAEDMEMAY